MDCPACGRENAEGARFCSDCGALMAVAEGEGLVGQTLGGRYVVKRVIGEGGMGVVYEAEQRMGSHLRKVAIKTLLPELSHDHGLVSRFYRECGTVSQLEHPNTIRFYDFGETPDGALYIAMEFVGGEPLTDVIAQGPMPSGRALNILRQVCGALHEAHNLGIVHRDLKPDNIILTERAGERDFVKLLDFGIAARTGPNAERQTKLTQQGTVLGTPPYMSPEQLAGQPIDGRSDIYSLAVIAYEMLTGRLPFDAESPWEWAHKHMTEAPRPLRTFPALDVPPAIADAVMRALSKRPEDRPRSALEFYRELCGGKLEGFVDVVPTVEQAPNTSPMGAPPPMQRVATEDEPLVVAPAVRTASAMAAPVMPPPVRRRRSGKWGYVVAAGGLIAAGALAAVLVFAPPQAHTATPPIAITDSAVSPVTSVAPLIDTADGAASEPPMSEEPPQMSPVHPPAKQPVKPKPAEPSPPASAPSLPTFPIPVLPPPASVTPPPAPQPSAKPPHSPLPHLPGQPVPGQPKPPTPSGPTGDAACAQANSLAASSTSAAVAAYNRCVATGGSTAAQRTALSHIRSTAPGVVRNRAFRGDCAGAKREAAAAASVGAGAAANAELAKAGCS